MPSIKSMSIIKSLSFSFVIVLASCSSKFLHYDDVDELQKNEEFDQLVEIKKIPQPEPLPSEKKEVEPPPPVIVKAKKRKDQKSQKATRTKKPKEKKALKSRRAKKMKDQEVKPTEISKAAEKRRPELEDSEGFQGRRPLVDPFRVGEKATLALTYFNVAAGYMTLETRSFAELNGRKVYHFVITVKSSKVFSYFYSVDDWGETYLDYDDLIPYTFGIHVKESKQLREIRTFFDWEKKKARYWDKKVTKDQGEKTKKKEWEILPFSQNVVSAIFYLRTFTLKPGKELAFRVADAGKNMVVTGKVLRRETIETEVGKLKTIVIQPQVEVDGVFKSVGDNFFWLTDDDRRFLVRIESKIKIGTIIGKLTNLVR